MKRASWGSKIGFIFAAAGSAVGLANIWRFPYVVGQNGGAAFILLYLFFLALVGLPVFLSEIVIGKSSRQNPNLAFATVGKSSKWSYAGKLQIFTSFLVSSFYSVVAGWILGYLVQAIKGDISTFESSGEAGVLFHSLLASPLWCLSFHLFFIGISSFILYLGVRHGIERGTKIMMPLLFAVLAFLVTCGLRSGSGLETIDFLFTPRFEALTPTAALIALGQAFFTLSLGQGTMITYGSYLAKKESIISSTLPVVMLDLLVSIMAAIAVFSIAFASDVQADAGPSLIFQTLPWAFSKLPGGYLLSLAFFLLVLLAAITSQISVMEPMIAYLREEKGLGRHSATLVTALAAFTGGVPAALSYNLLSHWTAGGMPILDLMEFTCSSILIPAGGLLAALVVSWRWREMKEELQITSPLLHAYLFITIRIIAPIAIAVVFLQSISIF